MGDGIYSNEKLVEIVMQDTRDIAEIKASVASAHRRIDENEQLTEGIHKLAENVATMSVEIKMLTEKFDKSIERIENGLKEQADRITIIEKEPSKKWDKFVWLIIAAVVSIGVSFLAGKIL